LRRRGERVEKLVLGYVCLFKNYSHLIDIINGLENEMKRRGFKLEKKKLVKNTKEMMEQSGAASAVLGFKSAAGEVELILTIYSWSTESDEIKGHIIELWKHQTTTSKVDANNLIVRMINDIGKMRPNLLRPA